MGLDLGFGQLEYLSEGFECCVRPLVLCRGRGDGSSGRLKQSCEQALLSAQRLEHDDRLTFFRSLDEQPAPLIVVNPFRNADDLIF